MDEQNTIPRKRRNTIWGTCKRLPWGIPVLEGITVSTSRVVDQSRVESEGHHGQDETRSQEQTEQTPLGTRFRNRAQASSANPKALRRKLPVQPDASRNPEDNDVFRILYPGSMP
jgi:hypothetical protein